MTRLIVAALLLGTPPAIVQAAPCKDARGRFVTCAKSAAKLVRCKDARAKFVKCGMSGAKAVK